MSLWEWKTVWQATAVITRWDCSYKYLEVDQGRSKMLALQHDFQEIFQSMGGTHCATEADVARLAVSLRVGFLLFCIDSGNSG
eukprot:10903604-Karenia_brevis.AAC.1